MGAHFALTIRESVDLAASLRTAQIPAQAISSHASAGLCERQHHGEGAWLFGLEGLGVSDELMALTTASSANPQLGPAESLKLAASAAVPMKYDGPERDKEAGVLRVECGLAAGVDLRSNMRILPDRESGRSPDTVPSLQQRTPAWRPA